MSHEAPISGGGGAGSSLFGSTFDYRSLLPQRQQDVALLAESESERAADDWACGRWLPEMTWRERVLGCASCMVAGYLLSFGSFFRVKDLLLGHPAPFVINATAGNAIALAGSCFLSGPTNQINRMCREKRRVATAMYLGSLVLTLFVAFVHVPGPKGLYLLILMLAQYVSITWYCLSYIPFAQEAVQGFVQRFIQRME
jgi:hypothetical protein